MRSKAVVVVSFVGTLVVFGGFWQSTNAAEEDSAMVKIWDAGAHYQGFWDAFAHAFKNRATWKQVSYGETTDYSFQGDAVLENTFFYISLNRNSQSDLYVKKGDTTLWRNVLYKVWYDPKEYRIEERPGQVSRRYGVRYGDVSGHTRILKNTPEEVIVEDEGKDFPVTVTYRVVYDKPWVEARGVKFATEHGIHGKVRIGLAPIEGGDDFVVDSLRDPPSRTHAPACKMLICFYEHPVHPFMWVISWSSPFEEADPWFLNDSGPKGDTMRAGGGGTWGGLTMPRKWAGCITSSWAKFGEKGSVVIGGLPYWNNWYREQVDQPIKKGEIYTSSWKPPYPGRWRMTVRVAERRYDQGFEYDGETEFPAKYLSQDVYDGNFTFTSPIEGWLDYILMYMYDRTKDTPLEIQTPMDQYRWTVEEGE